MGFKNLLKRAAMAVLRRNVPPVVTYVPSGIKNNIIQESTMARSIGNLFRDNHARDIEQHFDNASRTFAWLENTLNNVRIQAPPLPRAVDLANDLNKLKNELNSAKHGLHEDLVSFEKISYLITLVGNSDSTLTSELESFEKGLISRVKSRAATAIIGLLDKERNVAGQTAKEVNQIKTLVEQLKGQTRTEIGLIDSIISEVEASLNGFKGIKPKKVPFGANQFIFFTSTFQVPINAAETAARAFGVLFNEEAERRRAVASAGTAIANMEGLISQLAVVAK